MNYRGIRRTITVEEAAHRIQRISEKKRGVEDGAVPMRLRLQDDDQDAIDNLRGNSLSLEFEDLVDDSSPSISAGDAVVPPPPKLAPCSRAPPQQTIRKPQALERMR
ncbi:hypothetical protein Dimus_021609 [Dionaea muscipula]